jgi:hypothetical protein
MSVSATHLVPRYSKPYLIILCYIGLASREGFTTVAAPIAVITDEAGIQRELIEPSLIEENLIAEDVSTTPHMT